MPSLKETGSQGLGGTALLTKGMDKKYALSLLYL